MSETFDPHEIEPKWQAVWEQEGLYRASDAPEDLRPRFYALDMFPYPSGDLHMGHAEAFSGGEAVARVPALQGFHRLLPRPLGPLRLPPPNAAPHQGAPPPERAHVTIGHPAGSFNSNG